MNDARYAQAMLVESKPAPAGVDTATANVARIWDFYLGGKNNFPVDRAAARQTLAALPELRAAAREHRAFLSRAVNHLAASGIRQFVDIGCGLPTWCNTHEIARRVAPEARVIYVDYDSLVCAHARALLAIPDRVAVVQADVRRPVDVLSDPLLRDLIDFEEPVGVLMLAVMHFLTDADGPVEVIRQFRDVMAPGSHLALTHATGDALGHRNDDLATALEVYGHSSAPLVLRRREEVLGLLEGLSLVEPGLVWLSQWRPNHAGSVAYPECSLTYAALARRP